MKVLFFADIVGKPGRRAVAGALPRLREAHSPDLVIANGENTAGGVGINQRCADELFDAGIDAITLGNHAFRQRDSYELLDRDERIVRPANYPVANPGRGHTVLTVGGRRVGILNLSGALQLIVARSPFHAVEAELAELARKEVEIVIVDFHAEVTSEKIAMGWHLDGRVAAVIGTHTHVPTADARVLPGGTAFICDAGMCGARQSVLGVTIDDVLDGFRTQMPVRFTTAEEDVWINAIVFEVGDDGRAVSIEQILEPHR